jgi:hypothetical protein
VLGLVVRVDNIDVRDNHNAVVAHVPSTRFAIDPWSLLRLHVDVRQVELAGAEVSFVRTADGQVRLGNADTVGLAAVTKAGFPDLFGALTILDSGIEPPIDAATAAGFQQFAMVNGTVNVWDAAARQQHSFPNTDLSVAVNRGTRALAVNFATSGLGGRWTATINRDVAAATHGHALSIDFAQLTVADVLPPLGDPGAPVTADVPLSGHATVNFDKNGKVSDASAHLDLGAGTIQFGRKQDAVAVSEGTSIRVHYDPQTGGLVIDPSPFFFGDTRGSITGTIAPDGNPADGRYKYAFNAPGAILSAGDAATTPMVAQRLSLAGSFDLKNQLLNIDNVVIAGPDASITASGAMGFNGPSPSLKMTAKLSPMTVPELKQIWIPFIAPDARDWVMANLFAGRILSGDFTADVPPGYMWTGKPIPLPDNAMRLNIRIQDAALKTFGKLPPITKAAGNVVLAGSTFGIDFDTGEVDVPAGPAHVDAGAFAVSNLAQMPADGQIELELSGAAQALAQIADADPLNALSKNKISPSDLSGTGTASISVRMPLQDMLTEADVDWKVTINTKNLASKAPIQGRVFSEANVALTVKPDGLSVYGKAKIDGVPADVSMTLPLSLDATQTPGDRQVRMLLDDQARKRLGVGLDQVMSGTVSALITDLGGGGTHYDLDMERADRA